VFVSSEVVGDGFFNFSLRNAAQFLILGMKHALEVVRLDVL